MRAGIGLLALLVTVALIIWLVAEFELPKVKVGQQAKVQVRQIAGYSQDETPATDSFATQGVTKGSRLSALQVTSVTPGGAMDTFYGLRVDDQITAIGGTPLEATAGSDEEMAKSLVVQEGYQKKAPLSILRNGRPMTLPLPAGSPAAAAPAPPRQAPAQPAPEAPGAAAPAPAPAAPPAARPKKNTLQDQIQGIQDAAGSGGTKDQ